MRECRGWSRSGNWLSGRRERISYGFDSEVVKFERDVGVTGWRVDAAPTLGLDFSGAGLLPAALGRLSLHAVLARRHRARPGRRADARSLPFAASMPGLVLERTTGRRAQRRVTLEPRLLYLYTPYRDQADLPVFDTGVPDLNLVQLFRTNRYVGADRVSDANQASVGVTDAAVRQPQRRAVPRRRRSGQTFYFEPPRVALPGEPPRRGNESDLVARAGADGLQELEPGPGPAVEPAGLGAASAPRCGCSTGPTPQRVVNLGYRFQRDRLEAGRVSRPPGRSTEHWSLFARWTYDLQEKASSTSPGSSTRPAAGGCAPWRGDSSPAAPASATAAIYLQLELNGLSSVGSAADAFLEQAIRGYSFSRA